MRHSLKRVVCGFVLVAIGGLAYAGFTKPEDAIRYRKAVMTIIGHHFGQLAIVVKGKAPYEKTNMVHNATVIRTMSELPWEAMMFPGSYEGDTTLKLSAMHEKDKFMTHARQMEVAAQKLSAAAETGNLEAVKAQFGGMAGGCKACHSTFRK